MSGALVSGARTVPTERLGERAARAARVLAELGVGRGDSVAFCLRNDIPLFEGTYAAAMLGAYTVPMNWHFKAAEAAHVLRDSQAKVLVVHADMLPAIRTGDLDLAICLVPGHPRDETLSFISLVKDRLVPAVRPGGGAQGRLTHWA